MEHVGEQDYHHGGDRHREWTVQTKQRIAWTLIFAAFFAQVTSSIVLIVDSFRWNHNDDACKSPWAVMIIVIAYAIMMYTMGLSVHYIERDRRRPAGDYAMIFYGSVCLFALLIQMTLYLADIHVQPCDGTELASCVYACLASYLVMFVQFGGVKILDQILAQDLALARLLFE